MKMDYCSFKRYPLTMFPNQTDNVNKSHCALIGCSLPPTKKCTNVKFTKNVGCVFPLNSKWVQINVPISKDNCKLMSMISSIIQTLK